MTWKEYQNQRRETNIYKDHQHYVRTDIECPECSALIYKNISLILTIYPPQYQFRCMKCGWTGISQ